MVWRVGLALTGAAALAACGGGSSGGGTGPLGSGGWDGTKACDTLKQADVEAVTGQKAEAGKLDGVNDGSNGGAKTSLCTYALADGRVATFLTRVSEGEDLAKSVDAMKNPPPDMSLGPQEDVPGVGKAALWNDKTHQLTFWRDGDQMGIVGVMRGDFTKNPDLSQAKAQAIALAHKVGG